MDRKQSLRGNAYSNDNPNADATAGPAGGEQLPPSYATMPGVDPMDPNNFAPQDDKVNPYLDNNRGATDGDLERGGRSKARRILSVIFPCARVYRSTKQRFGIVAAIAAFTFVSLLGLTVIGLIIGGIIIGVEKGLTGESFWEDGHESLFRICESDSTSSKAFQLHTCNVFRPGSDLNAEPIHYFAEGVRRWSGSSMAGQAKRVDPVPMETLLLSYGLKCSVPEGGTPPPPTESAQIMIGGVGQGFEGRKSAIACNYYANGLLAQDTCGRYNDGGQRAAGKTWPMGINAIMTKHFGMTCEWVA